MEDSFIREDMGSVTVRKYTDRKSKNVNEVVVTFESKQIRDVIKARGSYLANQEDAGTYETALARPLAKGFFCSHGNGLRPEAEEPGPFHGRPSDQRWCVEEDQTGSGQDGNEAKERRTRGTRCR